MSGENKNTGGLSVGIQDGERATSSNPRVKTEAETGANDAHPDVKHVQIELRATSGFSGAMTGNGTINMEALFYFSLQNTLKTAASSNDCNSSYSICYLPHMHEHMKPTPG